MDLMSGNPVLTRYFHKDHLGSIAVITNESGAVLERLSYDAWGKRRYPDGSDDPSGVIASQTNLGFTGHEELAAVGLVHMNGRVYDPLLARFGTPDPTTENPFSTQGWNRYSYVGNSPLNFTDPSGYCFLGCFWKPIFAAIQNLFRSVPLNRHRAFTPDWSAPPASSDLRTRGYSETALSQAGTVQVGRCSPYILSSGGEKVRGPASVSRPHHQDAACAFRRHRE